MNALHSLAAKLGVSTDDLESAFKAPGTEDFFRLLGRRNPKALRLIARAANHAVLRNEHGHVWGGR